MQGLHESQRKMMGYLLDSQEGATLDELAQHLGITKTAAKEHLIKIENLGFLKYIDTKGSVGRPRRRYLLSSEGQEAFPKQYSWLSNVLLDLLAANMGHDKISALMVQLADKVSESMQAKFENAGSSLERLQIMTKVMNELGYRAVLKQSDLRKGAVLEATHCVYHSTAKKHPTLCQFDVRLIQNTTGMDVKLESCIARGAPVCRFCIYKK